MKNCSYIIKYTILLVVFLVFLIVLDKLFGNAVEEKVWSYFIPGGAFLLALLLANIAEKNWSGLISKAEFNLTVQQHYRM